MLPQSIEPDAALQIGATVAKLVAPIPGNSREPLHGTCAHRQAHCDDRAEIFRPESGKIAEL